MREEYDITKVDLTIPEFTKMSDLERIYLIELLLKDIRSNWDTDPIHRAKLAASLCIELTVNNPLAYKDFSTLYPLLSSLAVASASDLPVTSGTTATSLGMLMKILTLLPSST